MTGDVQRQAFQLQVVDAGFGMVALHNAVSNRFIKMSTAPRAAVQGGVWRDAWAGKATAGVECAAC